MRRRLFFSLLITLTLIFAQQGWALEKEAEEGYSKLHLHGYGELHYNVPSDGGTSKMDLHRMVWGLSYEFNDSISLHTEVDFEHAAQEMELEFAYLDLLLHPAANLRAGLMLMPVGPLNEFHEPPLFYSVERPAVHSKIIPTTWQEGGFGVFGSIPRAGLNYRIYVVSGLSGKGFSGSSGIRGGRGKGAGGEEQPITGEELAYVGRLEYAPIAGLDFGLSLYTGGVDQENDIMGDPRVNIYEGDFRLRMVGLDFQALYAKIDINDADKISAKACEEKVDKHDETIPKHSHTFSTKCQTVGEELFGWYVELAYHLSHALKTDWDLVPFVRYSEFNTQDAVPTGFTADPANDREITTYGIAYYPHPQVAFKADYQDFDSKKKGKNDGEQFNLGATYMFD